MTPFLVGVLLAVAVAAIGRFTKFDRDRSFYATVLIIIASYYLLFAILGEAPNTLVWETLVALAFSAIAIVGALRFPLLVGIGIVAHGLFDLVHHAIIHNPGVPSWWPTFCASIDVCLGLWVMRLSWLTKSDNQSYTPSRAGRSE